MLTPRWYPLKPHGEQLRLWNSKARFNVCAAGRRSGKTERAKRRGVRVALENKKHSDFWVVFAAPTRDQAKRIYWNDLKLLVPRELLKSSPRESDLTIPLVNGSEISVVGMDKPERIEGRPLDWICCDEYADMRKSAWLENIRPALATLGREGRAWMIGVPGGRNHFYEIVKEAQKPDAAAKGWAYFHWPASDILDPAEIQSAKETMDPLSYDQEFNANFINFEGRCYYPYSRERHSNQVLYYDPNSPLIFCFDFNVEPGVAAILQEHEGETWAIGEVWIPQNSNTPAVCRKLIADWSHHIGNIFCYGDATGGARGTAKVTGTDWDLIRQELKPTFKERLKFRVKDKNPLERVRVNAVNRRLLTADNQIHFRICPVKCPHLCEDYEGVVLLEGGSGEIDKDADEKLTHLSDAVGYYIESKFPLQSESLEYSPLY